MIWRLLPALALAYVRRACESDRSAGHDAYTRLTDYAPYNLRLERTELEFWLGYNHTTVHTNITVSRYTGGDIVLHGSSLLRLDEISVIYERMFRDTRYALQRRLTQAVCFDRADNLVISAGDLPTGLEDGFQISLSNHLNPESNTQLFGLYRSRDLLVTQNESAGFRRITYYPDRPDVLSVFETIIHAGPEFPVVLANGNRISHKVRDGDQIAVFLDPYPKPSYLFALVAGPLVSIERNVKLGQPCELALAELVGKDYLNHPLAAYCRTNQRMYEDVIIARHKALPRQLSGQGETFRKIAGFPDYVSHIFASASDKISGVWRDAAKVSEQTDARELEEVRSSSLRVCPLLQFTEDWSGVVNASCPYTVKIQIWAEPNTPQKLKQLEWALESVHKAMLYDEVRFGRYYDLSTFSVVACRDFNAGAMENKGLNIFNEALILADSSMTTDLQYERIRGVLAHEYFHNWSGDRVTIRDWFQLTLKEGFTVFRDQSFTTDLSQHSLMKRLRDINLIETAQFQQDSGPLAHPIRPAQYKTVENFYTVTVYEKGAEVVRMYETLLGDAKFRKATDHFFANNIDTAATCEDFLASVKSIDQGSATNASGVDWAQFFKWYSQVGTPVVKVTDIHWSMNRGILKLQLEQNATNPLVIPIRVSLINPTDHSRFVDNDVVVMKAPVEILTFQNITRRPVISLLRGFSAPIKIDSFQSDLDLAYLAAYDDDPYSRFKAFDQLISNEVRRCYIKVTAHNKRRSIEADEEVADEYCPLRTGQVSCELSPLIVDVYQHLINEMTSSDAPSAIYAELLSLPKLARLKNSVYPFEPARLYSVIENLRRQIQEYFGTILTNYYMVLVDKDNLPGRRPEADNILAQGISAKTFPAPDHSPEGVSRRAVKNAVLRLLLQAEAEPSLNSVPPSTALRLGIRQLILAGNANDEVAAMTALASSTDDPDVQIYMSEWLRLHQSNPLQVDRWLSAQVSWPHQRCLKRFENLLQSRFYSESRTPNRLRALTRAFAQNSVAFHQQRGYELVASEIIRWDRFNPKLAASLAAAFNEISLVPESLKAEGLAQLGRVLRSPGLSANTREIIESIQAKTSLVS